MILAGDVGGTKAILAVVDREHGPSAPVVEAVFRSADFPSLEEMAGEFLSHTGYGNLKAACLGIAGPVIGGSVSMTNLSWDVREDRLGSALNIPRVSFLNDVQAVGCAIPFLGPKELRTINRGSPVRGGAMAIIAPGTGLGEAILVWDGTTYRSYPTEGGHADFAPADEVQVGFLRHMGRRSGHVSWERVCSGIGIANLYEYLREKGDFEEPEHLRENREGAADPVPGILQAALDTDRPSALCRAVLETFVAILGAEAGNLALKCLATGGVYIGGGLAPRILDLLAGDAFMEAFSAKGRLAGLMRDIPVHVVLNPRAALLGASTVGLGMEGD